MKRLLATLFLISAVWAGRSQNIPTNSVYGLMNSSSYGEMPYTLWERYVWSYYADMYPQFTNVLGDVGHSGQGFAGDWQFDWQKRVLIYLATLTNSSTFDFWIMPTDNGGNGTNVYPLLLNFTNAPPFFYDGVSALTNVGISPNVKYNYFFLGGIPANTPGGDDGLNSGRQTASLWANNLLGTPQFDLLHELLTNGWVADIAGAGVLGFYPGAHPKPPGHLAMAQWTLVNRNAETNVAKVVINWNGGSVPLTDHCAVAGATISGNTFSSTIRFDRMGMGYDWKHGIYTNDATAAYAAMPVLAKQFNWIVQVTNLPAGTYTCQMDNRFIFSASDAQLAAGVNLWTNKNGWIGDQQQAGLDAICDYYGVDPVTLVTHSAGSTGAHGLRDDVNLRSDADGAYTSGLRGTNLVNALASDMTSLMTLAGYIRQAAVQTNHTITITRSATISSAPIALPSSALNRLFIGNHPYDGSVQTLNPPIFKWIYKESTTGLGYPDVTLRTFRFQLTTNGSFASPYWDITTSNNFYNCVQPITNADGSSFAGTCSWRIIYMNSNLTVNVGTGAVHSFTFAASPTMWGRSQFADTNYLLSVGTNHPHMFFTSNNLTAMRTFLHTNTAMGFSWFSITNAAASVVAQSFWNANSFTNQDPTVWAEKITDVALAYQIDSNAFWKSANPGGMVDRLATALVVSNYDQMTPYDYNMVNKFLGLGYDWAYSDMTTAQRSNVLWTLERMSLFCVNSDWWYSGTTANTNRLYADALKMDYESGAKAGHSHPRDDGAAMLYLTWAGMGESAVLRDCQQYALNYCIAQVDPYNGDEGRGYAEQLFRTLHALSAQLLLTTIDPRMTNNPWFIKYPKMFCYWEPLKYAEVGDQFGDFGMQPIGGLAATYQYHYKYYDMAILSQNPYIYQQFVRNFAIKAGTPDFYPLFGEAFLPFYFPAVPAQADWPDTYYFDEADGWCMSYAYPPNNWNCFTNGVGFVLSARPAGNRNEHGMWHDGAIQIFAYGAQVTFGGRGQYNKHPIFDPGLFIDGIGNCTPNGTDPTSDWYSRFPAFTNTPDYTFVQGDYSQAYNNSNFTSSAGGGLGNLESAYNQATNRRPYIKLVQENVLFPHKQYVVEFDSVQTTSNATVARKWNILEPTAVVNTNAISFTYTCTNFYNGSNVTVYVQHIFNPSSMTLFNGVGPNYAVSNIFTGENFSTLPYPPAANEPAWNSTIWTYNTTKTTNWHDLTVTFPTRWDQAAPTITRIDDYTVRVQQGAIDDTITFNPNYSGSYTFLVNPDAVGTTNSIVTYHPTHLRIRLSR